MTSVQSPTPLARPEFVEAIKKQAQWPVEQFLAGEARGKKPTVGTMNMIDGIIGTEYHGRTIIELIQNAHDQHDPARHDGRIALALDVADGDFGCLYVANEGSPVSDDNFEAMVEVAVSSKPPSQGIGNKGVGFKSVLHFSTCPEVYSRSSLGAPTFDGYTFRFGRPSDFAAIADRVAPDDPTLATRLVGAVHALTVTVPLTEVPFRLADFDGFSTVIRLPLSSAGALDAAREQLGNVKAGAAPLHLFLDRIQSIDVTVFDGEVENRTLTRTVSTVDEDLDLRRIELEDGRSYYVARRAIPEATVKAAIAETEANGVRLPGWDKWEGDAVVALAFGGSEAIVDTTYYTFLPMGASVRSPFGGHLQAPFFTRLDRREVDESLELNSLFLDECAALAADLLLATVDTGLEFDFDAALDLACWQADHLPRLTAALTARNRGLATLPFVPTMGDGRPYSPPSACRYWVGEGARMAPGALPHLNRTGLVADDIHPVQLSRLRDLFSELRVPWLPTQPDYAQWAEVCAAQLFEASVDPVEWADFYDELADTVPPGVDLAEAKIVIGRRRLLRLPTDGDRSTVMFPPTQGGKSRRFDPPDAVRELLSYVRNVPWSIPGQKTYRPGRRWLENYVAAYDSSDILQVVATAMQDEDLTNDELEECLLFANEVWHGANEGDVLPAEGFPVPTATGWKPAHHAYFGKGWGGTLAWVDLALADLLRDTKEIEDIQQVRSDMLRQPKKWLDADLVEPMREFLEALGVTHGLWPLEVDVRGVAINGSGIVAPRSVSPWSLPADIPLDVRQGWLEYVATSGRTWVNNVRASYSPVELNRLPGQFDWDLMSQRAKERYGELALFGLGVWSPSVFLCEWARPVPERPTWPSLITCFLATTEWVPQSWPGERSTPRLVRPDEVWWVSEESPNYLPWPPVRFRRKAEPEAVARLLSLGARHWDGPDSAGRRVDHLVGLVEEDGNWNGLRTEYESSWEAALTGAAAGMPTRVLVERRGDLQAITPNHDGEPVYYGDPHSPQTAFLASLPVWHLPFRRPELAVRVGQHLAEWAPDRFKSIAEAELEMAWGTVHREGPLHDLVGDWLETVVLVVLSRHHGFASRARDQERAVRLLRGATVRVVDDFWTVIDGHRAPSRLQQTSCRGVAQGDGAELILIRAADADTPLSLAERASLGIAEVLALDIADALRLALVDLQRLLGVSSMPTTSDIARAMGLEVEDVNQVVAERQNWRPDNSALIDVLASVAPDAAAALRDGDATMTSREDLKIWLEAADELQPYKVDQLLAYADQGRRFGPVEDGLIDLPTANAGLRALGLPHLSNADEQQRVFRAFVRAKLPDVHDGLRDRFVTRVRQSTEGMKVYAVLLAGLPEAVTPDPTWAESLWTVNHDLQAARIIDWLDEVAGPEHATNELPPVEALRAQQRRSVTGWVTSARDVVPLWCEMNDVTPPPPIDVAAVGALIRDGGEMDFGTLSRDQVLALLQREGFWPGQMPLTTQEKDLGIDRESRDAFRRRVAEEKEAQRRRESSVIVEGTTYSAEPDDLLRLSEDLIDSYAVQPSPGGHDAAKLADQSAAPRANARVTSGQLNPGRARRASSAPDDKTAIVGFIGEVLAGEWLRQEFGLPPEETWRSGYRQDRLGDNIGDDTLGYDFMVDTAETTYLVEVKTTTGSDYSFKLTERERWRASALLPGEEYWVLFIANATNAVDREFHWLPNPVGPEASKYRVRGGDVEFSFGITADTGDAMLAGPQLS